MFDGSKKSADDVENSGLFLVSSFESNRFFNNINLITKHRFKCLYD